MDANDLVGLAGLLLLGVGLWLWWPPVAFMVVGGLLAVVAVLRAWLRAR